jgi:LysR family glycine cleavage system transcriptional activator/LysR family transcriptional regulator of beta-lactamase
MTIPFKHYDTLRLFVEVAQHASFSDAAAELHLTKGAISYQIKTLEADLGLKVFLRSTRGVVLTNEGHQLLTATRSLFLRIEAELEDLKGHKAKSLTVGVSSYFASRWLSQRLMNFMQLHPDIQLRIQPMTQLFDLGRQGVDIAIRWGNGDWNDVEVLPFLPLPAWPVGNPDVAQVVKNVGLERAFSELTLLRDHDDSEAWSDWLSAAGLPHQTRKDTLIIPDPNVRVQAVIDGQGIALNDSLVTQEIDNGKIVRLSVVELSSYGYFLARPASGRNEGSVEVFVKWLRDMQLG